MGQGCAAWLWQWSEEAGWALRLVQDCRRSAAPETGTVLVTIEQYCRRCRYNHGRRLTINERYERGSIILTSNRAPAEWPELFGNPLLASAGLDRLAHHAEVVVCKLQLSSQQFYSLKFGMVSSL